MSHVIGRGRYARETYPEPLRAPPSIPQQNGAFLIAISVISPDPPPPPGDVLFALPNDNTLPPLASAGLNYVFVFPDACTLTRVHLHGKSATIGSANTLNLGGSGLDVDFDLFVNGAFVDTLLTLPAGQADVDIFESPGIAIPAGAEAQFILPVPGNALGAMLNFLFAFYIGP